MASGIWTFMLMVYKVIFDTCGPWTRIDSEIIFVIGKSISLLGRKCQFFWNTVIDKNPHERRIRHSNFTDWINWAVLREAKGKNDCWVCSVFLYENSGQKFKNRFRKFFLNFLRILIHLSSKYWEKHPKNSYG